MKTISFSTAFLLIAGLASTGLGAPTTSRHIVARGDDNGDGDYSYGTCSSPIVRKEWRALTTEQKSDYIDAVKCMMALPAIDTANVPGAVSRFDDFQGGHILATEFIHYVGQFLPWHRYFVSVYEKAIREECGWTLGQPYWDWTQDYQDWPGSEIWDPTTGFGGNGVYVDCPEVTVTCLPGGTGGGCITDGPFANITVHIGPADSLDRNDHCLSRDFHSQFPEQYFTPSAMNATMSLPTFDGFRQSLEGLLNDVDHIGQHGSGHGGTGGTMVDLFSSPGDPLFYLHHGQLDRLWWQWQNMNIDERLYEIAGPTRNYTVASPNVTLDYMLDVGVLADQVPIYDVMNIGGSLCYTYE
ncbi:Di-copper centre-containing protein [Morchella conica CCBAS932]|uniref:Di-copper centre-containing protein n=1 Tax=Morchella conica CCBAS932 TaxID=1392247 RepID=A0A3N4L021_9PEZI|nr:Di-copper centre-containing protein [Morchella conica CCBAS932]